MEQLELNFHTSSPRARRRLLALLAPLVLAVLTLLNISGHHRHHLLLAEGDRSQYDSEVENIQAGSYVSSVGMMLDAWSGTYSRCANTWARRHLEAFGCPAAEEFGGKGAAKLERDPIHAGTFKSDNQTALPFLVWVTVFKQHRTNVSAHSNTTCMGFMVDDDLIVTNAECVGPRIEWELPVLIWVHYPNLAGSPAFEAERVCWSHRLWWPKKRRAPYELAVVKLRRRIEPRPDNTQAVCLDSQGQYGQEGNDGRRGKCVMVSLCQASKNWPVEHQLNSTSHYFKLTPVSEFTGKECQTKYWHGNNAGDFGTRSRLMRCWESIGGKTELKFALCPSQRERQRAVFCYRDGCPSWKSPQPSTDGTPGEPSAQALLVGIGAMRFDRSNVFYVPLENFEMPDTMTSMSDVGLGHELLKDLMVDAEMHTHGGSARTICRNLGTQADPWRGISRSKTLNNAGYKFPPGPIETGWGHLSRALHASTVHAFDKDKCYDAVRRRGGSNFNCAENVYRSQTNWYDFKMPFLVELRVRKQFFNFTQSRGLKRHDHLCEGWLIDSDTVLAHAECVAPETMMDRLRGATVHFTPPEWPDALEEGEEWPSDRKVHKACWAREAAPYEWARAYELAVLRFAPPLAKYKPDLLQPACLDPYEGENGQGRATNDDWACSSVSSCVMDDHLPWAAPYPGQWNLWNGSKTMSIFPFPRETWKRVDFNPKTQYNATGLALAEGTVEAHKRLCPQDERTELTRSVLCRPTHCAGRSKETDEPPYLTAIRPGSLFRRHPGISSYRGQALEPVTPRHESDQQFAVLWLPRRRRQLLELLLALSADDEGTRDVSCQMLRPDTVPDPDYKETQAQPGEKRSASTARAGGFNWVPDKYDYQPTWDIWSNGKGKGKGKLRSGHDHRQRHTRRHKHRRERARE